MLDGTIELLDHLDMSVPPHTEDHKHRIISNVSKY